MSWSNVLDVVSNREPRSVFMGNMIDWLFIVRIYSKGSFVRLELIRASTRDFGTIELASS